MALTINLNIVRGDEPQYLPTEADLQRWYSAIEAKLDGDFHIAVSIVEPEYIQELNNQYRGKDYATNVLSFPFEASDAEVAALGFTELGDVIICPEVLEREASEQNKPLEHHWAHIAIHGMLHLLGYDHIEEEEAQEMEGLERNLLADLGIADPYKDDETFLRDEV